MLSIRLLLTSDAVGGVWRYTMELAAGLNALGASVRVVCLGPPPSDAQRAEAGKALLVTDLDLDWLAGSPGALARSADAVAAIARDWGAHSIHLHMPALAALTGWPVPVVSMAHSCVGTWWRTVRQGPIPRDLAWRATLTHEGLEAADLAVAPSRSFAVCLTEHYRLQRPVRAVLNGRRALLRPVLPRRGALTAGRLWDEAKNIGALDQAAALTHVEVRAAGPMRGPNGAQVSVRKVRHLGDLEELSLAREYAAAEVFVSVARYEPFGLSVLEAAQSGCALVLSDIPTFRELWDGAALFVDADDPERIARAIEDACARTAPLSAAARARAVRYTREAMARATLDLHRVFEAA